MYIAPMEDIILKYDVNYMLFTDDSQIYVVCNSPCDILTSLEMSVEEIR